MLLLIPSMLVWTQSIFTHFCSRVHQIFNHSLHRTVVYIYSVQPIDMAASPDAQIISQLQDTNIQINRLMVQRLNRLNDTIKRLQLTDTANFGQDPSMRTRTQQLQALLPNMKAALEHQQTFYHQCLKLQHIRPSLQRQVLRLASTLDNPKSHPNF